MSEKKYTISPEEQTHLFEQISTWIASTPPLLKPDGQKLIATPFHNDYRVSPVSYNGNSRLGFWYQHLCMQHFQSHPDYQLLAEEIQLNHNGRTLGAIDFIVENQLDQTTEHWEVAIKFYLLFEGLWYGPNSKDRLDLKLSHMLEHQLEMSRHDYFVQQYPDLNNIQPKLLMQGRLYTNPFQKQRIPSHCLNHEIETSQINGYWCFWHEFQKIDEALYLLKKGQWLTGRNEHNPQLTEAMVDFVHCQSESGDFWFILPDRWPNN
ncbi:DUF1853 family protein [Vibrio rumoiensis]|uniref:Type II citrate synthase n=1 Tax=Vibrio rumoiensis 1S-45 TaxID=1188252 RepID=A0A1E5E0L6_9VIBR|nr:DUF1853 family protein [Vibrio rumoiensis]OEF24025.1 type II citrate synthase [Vibrio rumoiensis 1S-45]